MVDHVPTGQLAHTDDTVAPDTVPKVPEGHIWQANTLLDPCTDDHDPALQLIQVGVLDAVMYVPAGHNVQLDDDLSAYPPLQVLHTFALPVWQV